MNVYQYIAGNYAKKRRVRMVKDIVLEIEHTDGTRCAPLTGKDPYEALALTPAKVDPRCLLLPLKPPGPGRSPLDEAANRQGLERPGYTYSKGGAHGSG